jgi:hypothetical protein
MFENDDEQMTMRGGGGSKMTKFGVGGVESRRAYCPKEGERSVEAAATAAAAATARGGGAAAVLLDALSLSCKSEDTAASRRGEKEEDDGDDARARACMPAVRFTLPTVRTNSKRGGGISPRELRAQRAIGQATTQDDSEEDDIDEEGGGGSHSGGGGQVHESETG